LKIASLPLLLVVAAFSPGCDVESAATPPRCGAFEGEIGRRGAVVIDSDYHSTNVALVGWAGGESSSLLSSGSTAPGLSVALSKDVIPASSPTPSGEVALLDRDGTGVVTLIDPSRCSLRQIQTGAPGFHSNPYDYLEVAPGRAYVPRYDQSTAEAPDELQRGGDVLVLVDGVPVKSIPLSAELPASPAGARPNPSRLIPWTLRGSRRIMVPLQGFVPSYRDATDGVLVGIDPATDAVDVRVVLPGMKNCGAGAVLPSGELAVVCSGLLFEGKPLEEGAEVSGVVILREDDNGEPREVRRILARDLGGQPLMPTVGVAGPSVLLLGAFGSKEAPALPDRWMAVDLASDPAGVREVARSTVPFSLGDWLCFAGVGETVCAGADGEHAAVRRFRLVGAEMVEMDPFPLRDPYGLPPRNLGPF
jgi:hypothetical protein